MCICYHKFTKNQKKNERNFEMSKLKWKRGKEQKGITLIALVVTFLFSYDEKIKCSNSKGFLLQTI